jgi:outer membrane receptor protein involved in Fe transport
MYRSKPESISSIIFLIAGLLALSLQSFAADVTGSISGVAKDTSAAVLAGMSVTATNLGTGVERKTTTDTEGFYLFTLLPIGRWTISAEMPGFKTFTHSDITLNVNETLTVNITMQVGEVAQKVEVSGEVEPVNVRSSVVAGLVDGERIVQLPLSGRNIAELSKLLPGVADVSAPTTIINIRGGNRMSVNGSRNNENLFLFDGGFFNDNFQNAGYNFAPPDAVAEFKLLTSNFTAEFGRNAGSVMNVVTKSGTNNWHGSAWEFLRNDALNARNFFAQSKPTLRQNQFGATIGGPIRKNKTFVFASYEGYRVRNQALATTAFPPTEAERRGDFSALGQPIIDPLTGQPFPNNQIPESRFDSVSVNILQKYVPLANSSSGALIFTQPSPVTQDSWLVKVDQNFSNGHSLNMRHYDYRPRESRYGGNIPGYGLATNHNDGFNTVVSDTYPIRPNFLNELRLTWNRAYNNFDLKDKFSLVDLGAKIPVTFPAPAPPNISVGDRFSLSSDAVILFQITDTLYGSDSLSYIRGKHSLKFGGDLMRHQYDELDYAFNAGSATGQFTGDPFADFLLGKMANYSFFTPVGVLPAARQWQWDTFVQDDYRIHPRLTLNLGVRYELAYPWVDRFDHWPTLRLGQQSKRYPNVPPGIVYAGKEDGIPRGVVNTDKNNFAPRVGLAWDVRGDAKTAVRAAYGIFYSPQTGDTLQNYFQPFYDGRFLYDVQLSDPFAGGVAPPLVEAPGKDFVPALPFALGFPNPDYVLPYYQQWNLTIQQQLFNTWSVQAAYLGKVGHHLLRGFQANPPRFIPGECGGTPCSTLDNIDQRRIIEPGLIGWAREQETAGNSTYHALQIEARKSYSRGLTIQLAYTLSKAIDEQSAEHLGNISSNPFNRVLDCARGF